MSTKPSPSDAEAAELFEEFRKLTPGERLALRMSAKAESKKAKREKRNREAEGGEAGEQIRRSWKDVEPSLTLKRASALSGISERELRRLIDEGAIFASQNRAGVKGSTLKLSKASLVDYLVGTIR